MNTNETTTAATALSIGDRWVGRCQTCKEAVTRDGGTPAPVRCACGGYLKWAPIRGFVSAVKCGPKCTSAVGPSCDCECGGHRHGLAHSL